MGKIELQTDLSEFFKPVTETQKDTQKDTKRAITEGLRTIKKGLKPIKALKGIKTGIEQLPQRLPQQKRPSLAPITFLKRPTSPPPSYMSPEPSTSRVGPAEEIMGIFPDSDVDFGIYDKGGEIFIGNKPIELVESEGKKIIIIGADGEVKKAINYTPGLWNLLTSKKYDQNDPIYVANDVQKYREILANTNTMYVNNDPKSGILKSKPEGMGSNKWKLINSTWKRQEKLEKLKKGSGVKKVVIPSDPNALLEKLNLLMASKAAGNTGVRNELVSVCDELKRQGIFDSKYYKKIMSLL